MDVQEVDRQLRKHLEQRVGRSVSDDEWELFKRFQLEQATAGGSTAVAATGWTGNQVAAFLAAILAALAGAGLLAEWDLMFSPGIRIPLGIVALLSAVVGLGLLIRGFGWDLLSIFIWGFFFLLPFGIAGGALVFKDRRYLTTTQDSTEMWSATPAEVLGGGLVLTSVVLFWVGRPRWAFLGKLWWFLFGAALVSFAVYWILGSDRPLAIAAAWLFFLALLLLADASGAEGPSASGAFSVLAFLSALGIAAADLVVEGRPLEIILWIPLIALAAAGGILCVLAVLGEHGWRVRLGRILVGLVAVAPALGVAFALQVSPW